MLRRLSIFSILMLLTVAFSGCVSEAVNKAIGSAVKDPKPLESTSKPDEPIFNPQSETLIVPSQKDEIQNRYENK